MLDGFKDEGKVPQRGLCRTEAKDGQTRGPAPSAGPGAKAGLPLCVWGTSALEVVAIGKVEQGIIRVGQKAIILPNKVTTEVLTVWIEDDEVSSAAREERATGLAFVRDSEATLQTRHGRGGRRGSSHRQRGSFNGTNTCF